MKILNVGRTTFVEIPKSIVSSKITQFYRRGKMLQTWEKDGKIIKVLVDTEKMKEICRKVTEKGIIA